ncbi:RNase J family beta-CASP ribonuclease [Aerococcaceae bacterium DSM 109653]|uniref:Ribonuclease J n=1 Tax=Fundicoccus ignavus TaxID=2664442 RepID=A0A6I2GDM3_9LACT|nr:ribonuclease J [Fundicoccus ignavus]MRI81385.1 RNase J family beta-CASP ribonuclease [Fundicoccus ignavus]MRI85376.1 RNase J family beta-CASP ribonuclease [Fundicoccus ignavus]
MSKIKIIPLGGVREEGKNIYVVEINNSIFVLDCGLVYPEDELLGIDAVIPDFSYLEENADRIVGIFLTHGHADAMGALPYLLGTIDAPVFGTELTIELASISAKAQGLEDRLENFFKIDEDTEIEFDDATISFFRTTHTIPDSVGIVVSTEDGSIVYTGDFKFDASASPLYKTTFGRLTDIGESGVLALLSDSAEAESTVENVSDRVVAEDITETFRNAEGRVIVACIGSNIARIQQVLDAAYQSKRTIFMPGSNMYEIVDVAIKLDKIEIPSVKVFGQISDLDKTPDNKVVILETGGTGEPIKTLQLMAQDRHPEVNIKEGDLVYLATTPSITMETVLAKTQDMIYRAGASVKAVTDNFKTSGHGGPNDLKMMINYMNPQYLVPINGEFRMLSAHAKLANQLGIDDNRIFIPALGDVIEFSKGKASMTGQVPAGNVLVDGIGVGDIGNVVLRDRRILSEDGIFVVVATISRRLKRILVGPQITSRGFVYMKTSTDLIEACSDMTLDVLEEHIVREDFDWSELKGDLRERLGKFLFKETKRRPVILPIIMEASNYQPQNDKE